MKIYKRILTIASVILTAAAALQPAIARADEKDFDESIRLPVRRLHPERARKATAPQQVSDGNNSGSDFARMRSERARLQQLEEGQGSSAPAVQQHSTVDKDWLNKLLSTDYTIKGIDSYMPQRLRWTDDPVPAASSLLADFFKVSLPGGTTRYMPQGVTMDSTCNALYLYFDIRAGHPGALHLRAQYYADDPLDIDSMTVVANGFVYRYVPRTVNRGRGRGRMIWENFDDAVTADMKDLVYALSHAKQVLVKYTGSTGFSHVKEMTPAEVAAARRSIDLYRSLGGSL